MKRKRLPPGDDGHTIVPMNVPGMPWFAEEKAGEASVGNQPALSKKETGWMIFGALKAALLVGGVMMLGVIAVALLIAMM